MSPSCCRLRSSSWLRISSGIDLHRVPTNAFRSEPPSHSPRAHAGLSFSKTPPSCPSLCPTRSAPPQSTRNKTSDRNPALLTSSCPSPLFRAWIPTGPSARIPSTVSMLRRTSFSAGCGTDWRKLGSERECTVARQMFGWKKAWRSKEARGGPERPRCSSPGLHYAFLMRLDLGKEFSAS